MEKKSRKGTLNWLMQKIGVIRKRKLGMSIVGPEE